MSEETRNDEVATNIQQVGRLAVIWLATLVVIALCGGPVHPVAHAEELVLMTPSSGDELASLKALVDEWGAARGVDVTVLNAPGAEVPEKVLVMTAGGTPPDVIRTGAALMRRLYREGVLQDLRPFVERDGLDLSVYPQAILDFLQIDGVRYSIPGEISIYHGFYDADMFASAGLPMPPERWSDPGWDWDEFVTASRRLTSDTDGDGANDRWGPQSFGNRGINMVGAWGLHWIDEEGEYLGDTPEMVNAFEDIAALYLEHHVVPIPGVDPGASVLGGTAAMEFVQTYKLNQYIEAVQEGRNIVVGPLPKVKRRAAQVGFFNWAVHRDANNSDLAWELVKFLSYHEEGVIPFGEASGRIPSHRAAQDIFTDSVASRAPDINAPALAETTQYSWVWKIIQEPFGRPEIYDNTMVPMGQAIITGEKAPKQALEEAAPLIRTDRKSVV